MDWIDRTLPSMVARSGNHAYTAIWSGFFYTPPLPGLIPNARTLQEVTNFIELTYHYGAWFEECEAAARRPLAPRMRYAFIKTYRPVMDDAKYRSFDTMEEYRRWCEECLPEFLGYRRV